MNNVNVASNYSSEWTRDCGVLIEFKDFVKLFAKARLLIAMTNFDELWESHAEWHISSVHQVDIPPQSRNVQGRFISIELLNKLFQSFRYSILCCIHKTYSIIFIKLLNKLIFDLLIYVLILNIIGETFQNPFMLFSIRRCIDARLSFWASECIFV